MLKFVNQKEIDGKIYTALRDDVNPRLQIIECEGEEKECRLKDVWNFNKRILQLWQQQ